MAFTYVNGNNYDSAASTTIVLSKPSGVAEGDIMWAFVGRNGSTSAPSSVPTDWTASATDTNIGLLDFVGIYYKVAGSSEPSSYTWTWSASEKSAGTIDAWRGGFDTASPIDVVSNTQYTTSNSTVRAASFSITEDASPVIYFGAVYYNVGGQSFTPPSGFTERQDFGSTAGDIWLEVSDNQLDSGATGDLDATFSVSSANKHAFAVSLTPSEDVAPVAALLGFGL